MPPWQAVAQAATRVDSRGAQPLGYPSRPQKSMESRPPDDTGAGSGVKGIPDGGEAHIGVRVGERGFGDRGAMQKAAPTETSEGEADAAHEPPARSGMIPLTQSKMHAM